MSEQPEGLEEAIQQVALSQEEAEFLSDLFTKFAAVLDDEEEVEEE